MIKLKSITINLANNHLLSFLLTIAITIFLQQGTIAQEKLSFNQDWEFTNIYLEKEDADRPNIGKDWEDQFTNTKKGIDSRFYSDISANRLPYNQVIKKLKNVTWEATSLPHNALDKEFIIDDPKEGLTYYRKSFVIPEKDKGKQLTLEFEGAMQIAWIWVNGKFIKQHIGGYLPFIIDLTNVIKYGEPNTILVKLDNRPHPLFPPGKPVLDLDFLYYSGIYRDVWLYKKNPLHITNPNMIDRPAGGGVFVTYPIVTDSIATINIKTNVINQNKENKWFDIVQELLDINNNIIASNKKSGLRLKRGADDHYQQNLEVKKPQLWFPNSPALYTLRTKILENGKNIDTKTTKIGIRSISISKETGLMLNGKPIHLEGSNRHQNYPWIGNALSNNANKRDAVLIKNSGLNSIRLAHYPQDPSFYKAADSLGLLIINPAPGWQYFSDSNDFQENAFNDIRQMIRRDRNHPSVILWELSLNEAYPPSEFRCKQVEIGKSEWKKSDTNFYTSGDSNYEKACYDVPYDDWGGDAGDRDNYTYPKSPYLIREYGDFEYGGFASTSRQSRGNGEKALLQQAWNFQWGHNKNRQKYPRGIGDLTWAFFDGMPGYLEGIEGWGIADLKRIPKFTYYFFQSQDRKREPMVYIANYWNKPDSTGTKKVIVYSNTDQVALYLNGNKIGERLPDIGQDTPYGEDLSKGGNPFDGGNANALKSPPFTFKNVLYKPGTLMAIGFKDGKKITTDKVITSGKAALISLEADTQNIPLAADGADVIFIRANILDQNKNPVYTAKNEVTFKVSGPGKILSSKVVNAEAGIATILLQATEESGSIHIEAEAKELSPGSLLVKSKQ